MRYKDDNKKESITLAAIRLINEIGLAEASMSKIAREAGVSAATLYVYFENKEDMIKKLFLGVKQEMQSQILCGVALLTPNEREFKRLTLNYIQFFQGNRAYFLFFEQYINTPLVRRLCREEAQIMAQPIVNFFELGKARHVFKPVDAFLLFTLTFSPLIQIAKRHFDGEDILAGEKTEEILQLLWESVKKQ